MGRNARRAKNGEHDLVSPAGPATTATRTTSSARCSAAKRQKRRKLRALVQPQVPALITRAREAIDNDERAKLYSEALAVYDEDQPWISMAHPKMFTAMREQRRGLRDQPADQQ
jgi:dipeptide transport system substrate-binding protein